jgi:peroxiredoxin
MKYSILAALVLSAAAFMTPARAELKTGDMAPDFTTPASLAGKEFTFSLAGALAKGPVVLYFYPAAFTPGCTAEAHDFAEATDKFKALGATVIGVSSDNIETLNKFSVTECRNKFAVAADKDRKIIKAYGVALMLMPSLADRTSFVIAPDGKIIFVYSALNPEHHVEYTLNAVKKWVGDHKKTK